MSDLHKLSAWTTVLLGALTLSAPPASAQTRTVQPILAFPEQGLDDFAAYQGYQTRFFRDTKGNVVQIYLDARRGRVVNLLPDAVNESVGFTVRDESGKPLRLEWGSIHFNHFKMFCSYLSKHLSRFLPLTSHLHMSIIQSLNSYKSLHPVISGI